MSNTFNSILWQTLLGDNEVEICENVKPPNDALMSEIQDMEKGLRVFHGEKINMERQPIARLVDIILEKSSMPKEVVEFFVKVRFFRRIKELNLRPLQLGNERRGVRDHKQRAQFMN